MYIFLDIDGVLNTQVSFPSLDPWCVHNFNTLLSKISVKIVISSSWRYMISRETMTLKGFEIMLKTHGLILSDGTIIDTTVRDEIINDRSEQILDYVRKNNLSKWVAIDDMTLNLPSNHFLKTNPIIGFSAEDVRKITGS